METLLIMIVCALVWTLENVMPYVLFIGALWALNFYLNYIEEHPEE